MLVGYLVNPKGVAFREDMQAGHLASPNEIVFREDVPAGHFASSNGIVFREDIPKGHLAYLCLGRYAGRPLGQSSQGHIGSIWGKYDSRTFGLSQGNCIWEKYNSRTLGTVYQTPGKIIFIPQSSRKRQHIPSPHFSALSFSLLFPDLLVLKLSRRKKIPRETGCS
jgi:hypothetical protein